MTALRAAEQIILAYFALLTLLAWARPLAPGRRRAVTGYGLLGAVLTLVGWSTERLTTAAASAALRDWLPAALLLVAYWQAGRFYLRPDPALQRRLLAIDERWLGERVHRRPGPWLALYCELSYLLCYAMPAAGLAALYLLGRRDQIDAFWTIVLVPALGSYAMIPFLPTLPPRAAGEKPDRALRRLNLWFLEHGSIQANTFPSGHVAIAFAIAFALLRVSPIAGVIGLWAATSISVATVVGRYHYLADGVVAAAISAAWYVVATRVLGV